MNFFNLLILIIFFLLFFIFIFYFLKRQKEKKFLDRGLNLALFLVTLPQKVEKEKQFNLQEYLKTAEQFYNTLASLQEKNKLYRLIIGNPVLVFEIAVHRIGEEIYFYVACPRSLAQLVEKQILAFWPQAQVSPTVDYNIFNPVGFSVGSFGRLSKSFILPLKSSGEFVADPLSSITSELTKLEKEGEGAAIQILIRKSKRKIRKTTKLVNEQIKQGKSLEEALKSAFSPQFFSFAPSSQKTGKPPEKPSPPPITSEQQEIISALDNKASKSLFDVNLRILASAFTESRAKEILNQLESSFEQFNTEKLNKIEFKQVFGKKLKQFFYNFSFRIFNEKEILLLSSEELATIFHFPSPYLLVPRIKWLKAKQAPPPTNLPEEGIIIGKSVFRGEERIVRILKDDRRRHFYIIGQTGTGKSVLLQEMIRQDIEKGEGVALIDPHGDLAERVLGLIPPSRIEDVVYFNPGDTERPIGLNMLEYDLNFPESKTFVVNELLEIFEKLYNLKALGFGGPVFEQYMRNALLLVMEDPESGSTLIEVPRVLADQKFRKYKLSKCKNIVVKNFWELEAEKAGGEAALANMVPYITSKMNIFIANDLVRPIIAQQVSSINFRQVMDEGKILIINLAKGRLGDINSYLLGMIIVGKILISAFSRVNLPEEKRRDFYLYIDEFHNVTTKTIASALAEARKFRLNLILAHQFIGQLDEETKKAIFGNIGSILAFRVGPDDAKYLITQFEPVFDENDLVNFDNYNGALRLLINGEASKPFNIVTFPPSKENPEVRNLIKELSRTKYGREKSQVETDLYQRLQKSYSLETNSFKPF